MEGVLRRGSRRACQTRLVVFMLIMSEDVCIQQQQLVEGDEDGVILIALLRQLADLCQQRAYRADSLKQALAHQGCPTRWFGLLAGAGQLH
jgi:hypothetical protein